MAITNSVPLINSVLDPETGLCDGLEPTRLGLATMAASMCPINAVVVRADLERAQKNMILDCELHLVVLISPHAEYRRDRDEVIPRDLGWVQYAQVLSDLPPEQRRVAEALGLDDRAEQYANLKAQGKSPKAKGSLQRLRVLEKFYLGKVLFDIVTEKPLAVISDKYGIKRGDLQRLQKSASTNAGMVTVFCEKLGWESMALLLSQFQERALYGVHRVLVPLLEIPTVDPGLARVLYEANYSEVGDVAAASPVNIERILNRTKALPKWLQKMSEHASIAKAVVDEALAICQAAHPQKNGRQAGLLQNHWERNTDFLPTEKPLIVKHEGSNVSTHVELPYEIVQSSKMGQKISVPDHDWTPAYPSTRTSMLTRPTIDQGLSPPRVQTSTTHGKSCISAAGTSVNLTAWETTTSTSVSARYGHDVSGKTKPVLGYHNGSRLTPELLSPERNVASSLPSKNNQVTYTLAHIVLHCTCL